MCSVTRSIYKCFCFESGVLITVLLTGHAHLVVVGHLTSDHLLALVTKVVFTGPTFDVVVAVLFQIPLSATWTDSDCSTTWIVSLHHQTNALHLLPQKGTEQNQPLGA